MEAWPSSERLSRGLHGLRGWPEHFRREFPQSPNFRAIRVIRAIRGPRTFLNGFTEFDFLLRLVFPSSIFIRNLARFIRLKEKYLAEPLIREDSNRNGSHIPDRDGDKSFPFRLKRGDIHKNPSPSVRRFSDAQRQNVARNPEVLDRSS